MAGKSISKMISFISLPFFVIAFPLFGAKKADTVTWDQIKESLSQALCVRVNDQHPDRPFPVLDRKQCNPDQKRDSLDKAIDRALEDIETELIVGLWLEYDKRLLPKMSQQQADETIRKAYFNSSRFCRFFLAKLKKELRKRDITCSDCLELMKVETRTVHLDILMDYIANIFRPEHFDIKSGPEETAMEAVITMGLAPDFDTSFKDFPDVDKELAQDAYAIVAMSPEAHGSILVLMMLAKIQVQKEPEQIEQDLSDEEKVARATMLFQERCRQKISTDEDLRKEIIQSAKNLFPLLGLEIVESENRAPDKNK